LLEPGRLRAGEPTPLCVAVIGDYGNDARQADAPPDAARPHNRRNRHQAAVADLVARWQPDMVVTTGDNNYPKGDADTIDDNVGRYYAAFIGDYRGDHGPGATENRFFPVLGNHDWDTPGKGCAAYLDYFSLPGNERYYEVVRGPVHFFMLDSDGREPDGRSVGSKQHRWFLERVASSTSAFQVVVCHHPPFSSGSHGGDDAADWRFHEHGIDLVLSGHDHDYERIERDGVTYVVNGAGGNGLRPLREPVPGSAARFHDAYGAQRIVVEPRGERAWRLASTFVTVDGREIDTFTIERPEPPSTQAAAPPPAAAPPASRSRRDITFISSSDPHYRQPDHKLGHHNDLNVATIDEMNRIAEVEWPGELGGGLIAEPRGVLAIGDLVDDGDARADGRSLTAEQFALYAADFGVFGGDARLRWPTLETWGNHDGPPAGREKHGFSVQGRLAERNRARLARGTIVNLAPNGLHCSWDWDDVHFVMLGIYPADAQHPSVKYSAAWHDPQGALSFLKQDLADHVGESGRPVVLISHCGFDTDWWTPDDWRAAYDAARDHDVILYLYGHTGTGLRDWAPEGEERKWTCINDGHADVGFFVIRITDDRIRAAYRCKTNLTVEKKPGQPATHTWDGSWGWKFPLDRKLTSRAAAGRR
jgi:hypothetical protein